METRAMKRKRLAGPTKDPFELIPMPLIHDLILQHFAGNEVKELFKVSKKWNKNVSNSNASMKRVELTFEERSSFDPSQKEVQGLLKSQKRYSSMKAHFQYKTNIQRKMRLLYKFSESLVELDITVNSKDLIEFAPRKLCFPKLKKLVMNDFASDLLPFMDTKSLDYLHLNCIGHNIVEMHHANHINEFLMRQPRMKHLIMARFNKFYEQIALTNVPFALKSLLLHICDDMSPITELHLFSLMRNMSNSLQHVHLNQASIEVIQLVINEMPKVNFFSFHNCDFDVPNLTRNTSISTLIVYSIPTTIPKSLLLALENLRHLEVGYSLMQNFKDDFKWIVSNAPKLQTLKAKSSQIQEIRADYQMLRVQETNINQDIIISTWHVETMN